jgi:hypothetical protein
VEADIGIEKGQIFIAGLLSELIAGMLLSTPAFRQWPTLDQPYPHVFLGQFLHKVHCTIRGLIIEDHDLENYTAGCENAADAIHDIVLFITRGDQDGNCRGGKVALSSFHFRWGLKQGPIEQIHHAR